MAFSDALSVVQAPVYILVNDKGTGEDHVTTFSAFLLRSQPRQAAVLCQLHDGLFTAIHQQLPVARLFTTACLLSKT